MRQDSGNPESAYASSNVPGAFLDLKSEVYLQPIVTIVC